MKKNKLFLLGRATPTKFSDFKEVIKHLGGDEIDGIDNGFSSDLKHTIEFSPEMQDNNYFDKLENIKPSIIIANYPDGSRKVFKHKL